MRPGLAQQELEMQGMQGFRNPSGAMTSGPSNAAFQQVNLSRAQSTVPQVGVWKRWTTCLLITGSSASFAIFIAEVT